MQVCTLLVLVMNKYEKKQTMTLFVKHVVDVSMALSLRDSCQLLAVMRRAIPKESSTILNRVAYYPGLVRIKVLCFGCSPC